MTKSTEETTEKNYAKEDIAEKEVTLASDTLVGDLRDAMLGRIRSMKKPWEQMSESEQRDCVEQFTNAAKHLTTRAVKLIAANGRQTITAQVEKVEIKDGLKTVLKCAKQEEIMLMLGNAQGHTVLIIAADAAEYEGEREPVKIEPDQRDFEDKLKGKSSNVKSKAAA